VISRRVLELTTAALTGTFGAAIVVSSLDAGVGWTSRGVGSGTFPFIAGVLILAGSLYNAGRASLAAGPGVLDAAGLRKLGAMLLPAILFVAAIPFAGLHVAAGAYAFASVAMDRSGSMRSAIVIGIVTPLALYAIFDWAFQVTLPRGMLGAAFGF
jgi:hypothetical protein